MDRRENIPIFYDRKQFRKYYLTIVVFFVAVVFLAAFGFLSFSITKHPELPKLNLGDFALEKHRDREVKIPVVKNISSSDSNIAEAAAPVGSDLTTGGQIVGTSFPGDILFESDNVLLHPQESRETKILAFYVNWDDNSYNSLAKNINQIDQLVPEWFHIFQENGELVIVDDSRKTGALEYVHNNRPELPITPLINNFNPDTQTWDEAGLEKILADSSLRTKIIKKLAETFQANGFHGINIDFENVSDEAMPNLVLFMQELYATFHQLGMEVSQDIPLVDVDFSYDPAVLGQSADFLVLMAYDQNTAYATGPGPVASQIWFEEGLKKRISQLPANKYVIALGNYGYDWNGETNGGSQTTFDESIALAKEKEVKIGFDGQNLNPKFDYTDESGQVHHVWFLDATTVFNEIVFSNMQKPRGYALWRLGSEDVSVWKVFANRNELGSKTIKFLTKLEHSSNLTYEGKGEVIQVTARSKEGQRKLRYNQRSGYIKSQEVIEYPSPYIVSRWGSGNSKKIVLTFDDGPDDVYTKQILDILKEEDAHATFFIIGANATKNPRLIRRIADEGHEIGSHTFTHPNISNVSSRQFEVELSSVQLFLGSTAGINTLLFRPPYGEDIEPETIEHVAPLLNTSQLGYYTVAMHIDPNDWDSLSSEAIIENVIRGAESGVGNIILLHDGGGDRRNTVEALPKIISELRGRGFEFVTVADLINVPREKLMPAVATGGKAGVYLNSVAFKIFEWFGVFLSVVAIAGISVGILRSVYVGILAIIQSRRVKKRETRGYSQKHNPFVSVVVPAFDEGKVIVSTVMSLLASTYDNFEIVVIDDGSEDDTYEKVRETFSKNEKVRVFSIPNGGKSSALNYGISLSMGEIIVALDADTIFESQTIEKLVRHFENSEVGAVAGNAKVGNRINALASTQALEYVTSQNLDRRAFEVMNCIPVVPGAVGAWRKEAIEKVGGFSKDTLAEDADLTFSIIKAGYKVVYENRAIALTEAPDSLKSFVKQRFRWMFGTLQTTWKHKEIFFRPKYGALGFFTIPNVVIFQIIFPLISPFMDLAIMLSAGWTFWQVYYHPNESSFVSLQNLLIFYLLFLAIDLSVAALAFVLEKEEKKGLLVWVIFQRFFYRQIMYYVAIKTIYVAIRGSLVGWNKFERKATVKAQEAVTQQVG